VSSPRDNRQNDLFRPSLEMIVTLRHSLVRLAAEINWVRGWTFSFRFVGLGRARAATIADAGGQTVHPDWWSRSNDKIWGTNEQIQNPTSVDTCSTHSYPLRCGSWG
jgi:hypothetical protein